jgi:hypothetical protein
MCSDFNRLLQEVQMNVRNFVMDTKDATILLLTLSFLDASCLKTAQELKLVNHASAVIFSARGKTLLQPRIIILQNYLLQLDFF